ncbi:MAG: hypothetical protein JSR75_19645 [Proteobacteria bacterium]|nr:hypothetical protein [Pseudomonadota bacterium]
MSAAEQFYGGIPGALCALIVEGQMFGLVRRDGRQFNVWLAGSQGQHCAAVCSSYALARAALAGLVPAQDSPHPRMRERRIPDFGSQEIATTRALEPCEACAATETVNVSVGGP